MQKGGNNKTKNGGPPAGESRLTRMVNEFFNDEDETKQKENQLRDKRWDRILQDR